MSINREKQTSFTVILDNDIAEKLRQLAKDDQRSVSKYISILIQNHIKNKE